MRRVAHGLRERSRHECRSRRPYVRATAAGAAHESIATELLTRIWRRTRQPLWRLTARREPQTAEELMACARSIQHSMPALAAELQCMAQHGLDADA
jgi:hypothetical protein